MRLWKLLDIVGRTLIGAGILVLLFVVYQLWGTGLIENREQADLKKQFQQAAPPNPPKPGNTSSSFSPGPPPPPPGNAVAAIRIPKIGVDKIVVQGVSVPDLKRGPGLYPNTSVPGQPGNSAIAGHRTTYGQPFFRLDELQNNDQITISTRQGSFEYRVFEKKVVSPSQNDVLNQTKDNRLTLTTCNPRYSAATRLIIVAKLVGPAAPASPKTKDNPDTTSTSAKTDAASIADAGLSGQGVPKAPAIAWGIVCIFIFAAGVMISKRWKRWPTYLICTPIFLFALFFFFENFSRLLPANV